jgi:hypothetical protein
MRVAYTEDEFGRRRGLQHQIHIAENQNPIQGGGVFICLFPLWHAPASVWCSTRESHVDVTPQSVQPISAPQGIVDETAQAVAGAKSSANTPQDISAFKRLSPEEKQYRSAIAMSSADLDAILAKPTERITKKLGHAIAHEEKAKNFRDDAQHEFDQNIAFYYEAKQRLLNPGYRTDVDGGKDRTPEENEKNFGSPNWAAFNKKCAAYSLQHADRKLKAFAQAQGLLADGGDNIDDPEPEGGDGAKLPEPRRTPDQTAQKRYEHIATAAMVIANSNPEGEIEKQILAAAEHVPTPQMPLPPDIFTEVLTFITNIASSITDKGVKAEAKRLLGKMLLHRPTPDPAKLLAEASEEEKRKRTKRLAQKNGQALGSASYNPPQTSGTSEPVQKSDLISGDDGEAEELNRTNKTGVAEPTTEEASAKSAQERAAVDADDHLTFR